MDSMEIAIRHSPQRIDPNSREAAGRRKRRRQYSNTMVHQQHISMDSVRRQKDGKKEAVARNRTQTGRHTTGL